MTVHHRSAGIRIFSAGHQPRIDIFCILLCCVQAHATILVTRLGLSLRYHVRRIDPAVDMRRLILVHFNYQHTTLCSYRFRSRSKHRLYLPAISGVSGRQWLLTLDLRPGHSYKTSPASILGLVDREIRHTLQLFALTLLTRLIFSSETRLLTGANFSLLTLRFLHFSPRGHLAR